MRPLAGGDRLRWAVLLAPLLALLSVAVAACDESPANVPALPRGFVDAGLPDVPMDLYVYTAPEEGISIPTSLFRDDRLPLPSFVPQTLGVTEATSWVGPGLDSFGASLRFADAGHAEDVAIYLDALDGTWHQVDGPLLTVVEGDDAWAMQSREAVRFGLRATLLQKHPDTWGLLQELPASPPAPPVAAGFLRLDGGLLDSIADRVGIDATGVTTALNTAKVGDLAFGIYAEQTPALGGTVDVGYMEDAGAGILVVARSGYPGFVVSMAFGAFTGQAGLQEVPLGEATAHHLELGGVHLLLHRRGNLIFVALAPDRGVAEALVQSLPQ